MSVLTSDRYQLQTAGNATQASLHVVPLGGRPPYTFHWWASGPAGEPAGELLSSTDGAAVFFRAGQVQGPYHVHSTVTDADGREHTASLVLRVGGVLALETTTERVGVLVGGGPLGRVTVHLSPRVGTPPFDVSWTCTGPDGNADNERLNTAEPLAPRFTSGDRVGMYVLTAAIVDSEGVSSSESVIVIVGQMLGLDVIADRAALLPGGGASGMVTLLATPIGGREPYEYDWEVIGPDGQAWTGLLWDSGVRSPIFESAELTGTFLARCAVTDAAGTTLIGSTPITVGQQISVDVTADRLALPSRGTAASQAALTADVRGGRDPLSATWQVIGPGGGDSSALLSTTTGLETVFTPDDQPGSYLARCTVTEADGISSADSLVLMVGGTLGAAVVAEKTALATGGATPTGTTSLNVQVCGGVPPYSFDWLVINSAGELEPARLDYTATEAPTFTSSPQAGAYAVICKVTDAAGATAVDAVDLMVGQPLNVDVTVDKQTLATGGGVSGQAQLITTVNGGSSPYTYQWSVTGPGNTPDPSRLSSTLVAGPVFTSEAATGTYRLTLTTTDAAGVVFVDSVEVVVSSADEGAAGQRFSADVSIDRLPVPPSGGTAVLTVMTVGGTPPISYAWTVTDPDGATDNSRLDSTSTATVIFTSSARQGTYRVRCTVSDARDNEFTDSVQLTVSDEFNLDVTAAVALLPPGDTVNLFADRSGGAADLTYSWRCLDDAAVPAGTFSIGSTGPGTASQVASDDVTNAWTAPSGGAGTAGTYRIQVTATDAQGKTATDSVPIVVQSALSLNVTASDSFVVPGTPVTLLADQSGGEAPFSYAWEALDSTGDNAGTFTTGAGAVGTATQNAEPDDATNGWSVAAEGTYTIICTVADNAGQVFTDSVPVVVTLQQAFSLDVTADSVVVAPGETVALVGDRTGGTPSFDYAWSVLDESGAAGGTLGSASQSGVADDTTNSWTAPSGAGSEGTYRIYCTATDAWNRTATDSTMVEVGTLILQNTFWAPVAANVDGVLAATGVELSAEQGGGGQQITTGINDLADPRNLVIHIVDTNDGILSGSARITGLDPRGAPQVEVVPIVGSGLQYASGTGAAPFAAVSMIELYDLTEVTNWPPGNIDLVSVGVGNKFGLTNVLSSASDVLYTKEDQTVVTSGFTVDVAAGQQGITFATAPDGSIDYVVVFRAR